jgi:excisionase family DNA binding protein
MSGKRRRQIDLSSENGTPVTTGELAQVTGLSVRTIQRDIVLGELKAGRRWQGTQYRIAWEDARLYAARVCALSGAL